MPSIDIVMAQSVRQRRTLLDVISAAVQPVVVRRDISDVKTAFSSWDNCMNAVYCKWPVIAIMVVGGLFLISIIWCIARCACCGMSFCCECCYCLKCCGNCCGCCDPPRNRKAKYLDEPYLPPNQGYRSEAPMTASAMPVTRPPPMQPPPPQQFASFDVSKTADHGNDDALPVMPSWETADTKKVYVEEEMEMANLGKIQQAADHAPGKAPGQGMGQPAGYPARMGPGAGPRSTGSPSPISSPNNMASPYGPPCMPSAAANRNGNHPAASNGYLATGAIPPAADPYGRNSPEAYNNNTGRHSDVSELSADYTLDYNHGAPAMGAGRQPSRPYHKNTPQQTGYGASSPPGQQGNQGYGQSYQNSGYNDYRRNGPSNGPSNGPGYGRPNIPMAQPMAQPVSQPSYSMEPPSDIPELDSGDSSIPAGPSYGAGAGAPGGPGRYGTPNTAAGPYGTSNTASGPYEIGTSATGGYAPPSNGPMSARPPPQRQYTGSSATGYNAGNASRSPGGGNAGGNGYGSSYGNSNSNGYGSSSFGNANVKGYGSSSANGSGYGNMGAATNNGYGNMGAANGYGALTSPPPQNNSGAFGIAAGGTNSSMNTGSRPMTNSAASPPPLAQPQPARNYGGYSGYRGL